MAKKKPASQIEAELVGGLEQLATRLRSNQPLDDALTVRRFSLDLSPSRYRPKDVKCVRGLLRASQPLFAQFLGVSVKTVRAWEAGKAPSGMAARFMDEIRRDPAYWQRRLVQAARPKTG